MSDSIRDDSKQNRDDGGPAFPHQHDKTFYDPANPDRAVQTIRGLWHGGMTVRDYFAGQALVGVMTGAEGLGEMSQTDRHRMFDRMSALLYEAADAMLAARKK